MIKHLKYSFFTLLIASTFLCCAQDESAIKPFEDIIIQTDRDVYVPGETIWFKADYLLQGKKSDQTLSKIIYIELLSLNGDIIDQEKYQIIGRTATGAIEITDGLLSGYYIIRAYTQYQRNFNSEHYAEKYLTVINPAIPLEGQPAEKDTVIEFALINIENIATSMSEIAVKIDPRLANEIDHASIVNQHQDTVCNVKFEKNGLGSFHLQTHDTLRYFIQLNLNNGTRFKQKVPDLADLQYHLGSKLDGDSLELKLTVSTKSILKADSYQLTVYSGSFYKITESNIQAGKRFFLNLENEITKSGLLYLVLSDKDEVKYIKVLFNNPESPVPVRIQNNKGVYSTREAVKLKLVMPETANQDIADVSITVVKNQAIEQNNDIPQIIVDNPHLLDDYLRFKNLNKRLTKQVELLLAFYGQRLLKTNQFVNYLQPSRINNAWLPDYRGVTISGKVTNKLSKEPQADVDLYIATISDYPQLHIYHTNAKGEFISSLKHVEGAQNMFLCVRDENESKLKIFVNKDYSGDMPDYVFSPLMLDTSSTSFIKSLYISAQLDQHFNQDVTIAKPSDTLKPIRFTRPKIIIAIDDYIQLPSLKDVINELVPYVRVRQNKSISYLSVVDEMAQKTYEDPLVLLDNIPIFNIDALLNVDPNTIRHISVINRTVVYGDQLLQGIVMFESNTDNFGNIELPVSSTFFEFNAGQAGEIFAERKYDIPENKNERIPDFRNTLYWNSAVNFVNSESTVSFYTSDEEGVYQVLVRGVTMEGKTFHSSSRFSVSN